MGHWGSCGGRESESEAAANPEESAEDIDDDWRWYVLPLEVALRRLPCPWPLAWPAGGRTGTGPGPGPKGAGAKAKAGGS